MNASLRALLSNVIDYAGLFPPAALPLDQALGNYARYRQGPDAWMLGRFVIAATALGQLAPYRGGLAAGFVPVGLAGAGRRRVSRDTVRRRGRHAGRGPLRAVGRRLERGGVGSPGAAGARHGERR